jgi:hypothetical protein
MIIKELTVKTFLALLIISTSCFADEWTRQDTYREGSYFFLDAIDWLQTRNIAKHPNKFRECTSTFALGEHPSVLQVNRYFAGMALAHVRLSYALRKEWRHGFQYVSIGFEFREDFHNHQLGISARF